jgi:hypothetical protein
LSTGWLVVVSTVVVSVVAGAGPGTAATSVGIVVASFVVTSLVLTVFTVVLVSVVFWAATGLAASSATAKIIVMRIGNPFGLSGSNRIIRVTVIVAAPPEAEHPQKADKADQIPD